MEHLDAFVKILAVAGSFLLGMRWVVKRIESGQEKLRKGQQKLRKELAARVDWDSCRFFREKCGPFPQEGTDRYKAG